MTDKYEDLQTYIAAIDNGRINAAAAALQLEQVLSESEPAGAPLAIWIRKGGDAAMRTLADHISTAMLNR